MSRTLIERLIVIALMLASPTFVLAQEATVRGTVTDQTGGVLPGVTVTAQNEATGNTVVVTTDGRGTFLIPVRIGQYRITAELQGFTAVVRTGLELLVGQERVVTIQMMPSTVEETITVTGEAPLIDVTKSKLGGNIDPRQLSELPVNGRDWKNLVMLLPGSRTNAVDEEPVERGKGAYQINLDGQQVTGLLSMGLTTGNGQPRFSRDAIAEFEFISNRFDASQGRSSGVQVNAITKSGTNTRSGSASGYFRDDKFNAADFIQKRVLPYSNQQVSGTYGGPIVKDKVHYLANWEFEHEPQEFTSNSSYPAFNIDLVGTRRENKAGLRFDFQLPSQSHLAVRENLWRNHIPYNTNVNTLPSATIHASRAVQADQDSDQLFATLTKVLGGQAVNEIRGGFNSVRRRYVPYAKNPKSLDTWLPGFGSPAIQLRGYAIGTATNAPQYNDQRTYQIADALTFTFTMGGRHALKMGGEFIYHHNTLYFCNTCNGLIDATSGPVPTNIQDLFPVWNDASTWNLAALSPITRQYRQGFGNMKVISPRQIYASYVQDDWTITPKVTLNLGVRYDLYVRAAAEDVTLLPFLDGHRHADRNNIQPRLGFAWSLNDRTVIRGGSGLYYADVSNQEDHWARAYSQQVQVAITNDGRPDFAANPWNGPVPTVDQAGQLLCTVQRRPGCVRTSLSSQVVNPRFQAPYSYQTSIGFQHQVGPALSIEADYVYTRNRHEVVSQNLNLTYNPATRANYPFTDISRLPYPDFALVAMDFSEGWSNLHSVQTAFTKRMSQRWQASATYTLSWFYEGVPAPLTLDLQPAALFPLAADLDRQYSFAATDQRHRAVFNGLWDLGYGFQLSGLYFFGSGQRFPSTYGADLRQTGQADGRLRPDGTIVPRNNVLGKPIHRVDLRIQRRFLLVGSAKLDGMLEVFNLLNHENYGSYVTQESNNNYGKPTTNLNVAFQPRMLQLGFRLTF